MRAPLKTDAATWAPSLNIIIIIIIIFFFSLPFFKAILKTAELPSLRDIVSSLYQLFVPRFAMASRVYVLLYSFALSYT